MDEWYVNVPIFFYVSVHSQSPFQQISNGLPIALRSSTPMSSRNLSQDAATCAENTGTRMPVFWVRVLGRREVLHLCSWRTIQCAPESGRRYD